MSLCAVIDLFRFRRLRIISTRQAFISAKMCQYYCHFLQKKLKCAGFCHVLNSVIYGNLYGRSETRSFALLSTVSDAMYEQNIIN